MKNIIACRPGCCDAPLPEGMAALKEIGISHFEVNAPGDNDYAALAAVAVRVGVKISSIGTDVKLDNPADVKRLEGVIKETAGIGTKLIFLSASPGKKTKEECIPVLKKLADKAAAVGVVLSLETHPPYGHNGETTKQTMKAVNSRGIGYNYDTANVYYYNPKGINGVEELKKALPYVTSVHLKESAKGEPESFDFPALGEGIVDFPEIFRLLGARGFRGPYTMELEGPLVSGLPLAEQVEKVKSCLDYLKRIGAA